MRNKGITVKIPERGRNRLLSYADSFRELADIYTQKIGDDTSGFADEDRQNFLYQKKLNENRELIADHLQEMAHIMKKVAKESFTYHPLGEKKFKQIYQALKNEKIYVQDIYYIEGYHQRVEIGINMCAKKGNTFTVKEVADMLSILFDVRLMPVENSLYLVDEQYRNYTFVEECGFITLSGVARAVKEEESVSGDNYAIIEDGVGKVTAILSDGMGSGEKASSDSEMVVELLEKLLDAGFEKDNAIQMINNTLILKGEEQNMSTLDICEVDLYSGVCTLTKVGAASTFLKRGHLVEPVSAHNLPLGIFQKMETETTQRRLMDGDYIIMVSDGVLDGISQNLGEDTMAEVISRIEYLNPGEIANYLLNYILHITKGKVRDDMTIIVIGLWENL